MSIVSNAKARTYSQEEQSTYSITSVLETHRCLVRHAGRNHGVVPARNVVPHRTQARTAIVRLELFFPAELGCVLDMVND